MACGLREPASGSCSNWDWSLELHRRLRTTVLWADSQAPWLYWSAFARFGTFNELAGLSWQDFPSILQGLSPLIQAVSSSHRVQLSTFIHCCKSNAPFLTFSQLFLFHQQAALLSLVTDFLSLVFVQALGLSFWVLTHYCKSNGPFLTFSQLWISLRRVARWETWSTIADLVSLIAVDFDHYFLRIL